MTDRYVRLVDGVEIEMSAEEIIARQTEEATPPVVPLSARLETVLVELLIANADILPAGLPTQIFQLKGALKEMALFMPEALFASEAQTAITAFALPEALEPMRSEMLAVFNGG